ncbi:MAG: Threonine--tRNA ligase [Methanomassiliicoccales archaeon PtaU1.Bin124]|nr:MAG: Threonine--tRNA ligase [Methanomassiliicoccales archaeon PtaU1.Bin124]
MKTLYIHADFMEYETKKPTPVAEELPEGHAKGRADEVLVAFITVEKKDEGKVEVVAAEAAADLAEVMKKVGAQRVMLYPYAHLSPELSDPKTGKEMLRRLESDLKEMEVEVIRAPFGWYKAFKISCKGHPLSELSRDFEGKEAAAGKKGEEKFIVLLPDGTEVSPLEYKGGTECFQIMMAKEAMKKDWPSTGEVKYARLCKKFGIQWESMSDVGHMCFSSKGALMFDLCSDYSWQIVNDLKLPVYTVKGTNMFSLDEGPVAEHAKLFGDRLYKITGEKKDFVLRYAACHQQFAMMRNWNISYKSLPYGAFEVADSYRFEQSGETMLCFRTRRMNMPDLHVICKDIPESEDWFMKLDERIYKEANKLDRDYEMLANFSSWDNYQQHKEMMLQILRKHNKPALLHFYPEGINYYWTVNIEYHILDDMKRAREIGTVQIDVGNANRFGIAYTDENGKKVFPVILHCAVIGTIERYLYTLFDTAVMQESQGKIGTLPLWVNPEQVRFMSVSENHLARARDLADRMRSEGIRVGLDDRSETVGKKVREAKQDWVAYAIVIGDKEVSSETLMVYDRAANKNVEMTLGELIASIKSQTKGMPNRPMYMPYEMSRQVDF